MRCNFGVGAIVQNAYRMNKLRQGNRLNTTPAPLRVFSDDPSKDLDGFARVENFRAVP